MSKTMPPEVGEAVKTALIAALAGDREMAATATSLIVEHGIRAVHGAMCAWAHLIADQMSDGPSGGDFWYVEIIDVTTGQPVTLDQTTMSPEGRDVIRLVTCYKNDDHQMMAAILKPYWQEESDRLAKLFLAMLAMAADAARHAIDRQTPETP